DVGASATGNGASANSGSVTIAGTNELLFGAGITANVFTGPASGFVERVITSPDGDIVEDKVASAAGTYDASATLGSGAWTMQVAVFRAMMPMSPPVLRIFLTATNTAILEWSGASAGFTLQEAFN